MRYLIACMIMIGCTPGPARRCIKSETYTWTLWYHPMSGGVGLIPDFSNGPSVPIEQTGTRCIEWEYMDAGGINGRP